MADPSFEKMQLSINVHLRFRCLKLSTVIIVIVMPIQSNNIVPHNLMAIFMIPIMQCVTKMLMLH